MRWSVRAKARGCFLRLGLAATSPKTDDPLNLDLNLNLNFKANDKRSKEANEERLPSHHLIPLQSTSRLLLHLQVAILQSSRSFLPVQTATCRPASSPHLNAQAAGVSCVLGPALNLAAAQVSAADRVLYLNCIARLIYTLVCPVATASHRTRTQSIYIHIHIYYDTRVRDRFLCCSTRLLPRCRCRTR